jgi:hypothetical protein
MNLATAPNVVFHYFLYFSSPFANFSKGLEIRLSLSPATLFSGASLPNHTKMFELVHLVTSMEDFGPSLVCSLGLSWQYKRFLFCFGFSSWPSTNYFFSSPDTISITLSSSHSKLGRQPCWVSCLLVCVSGGS